MNTSSKTSNSFIARLSRDFPDLKFQKGEQEHWSPRTNTITYNPNQPLRDLRYGVLHELAHARLNHTTYGSDFELLKMESLAWSEAARIGRRYNVRVSSNHIQNCLDTYRDWLHRRSTCPTCGAHSLQKDAHRYQCLNCQAVWRVTSGRFVRPYRRTHNLT
ncbi:hypothetical protein A3E49_00025 [Candidatus Saccharibacteria bacterium RIFCSPHIGHO2_12_FULL_49_19]|nr:MAG: hypothetical protein A2708_01905 [Candidatus Saccharibacteria bacterium RIFCSPHIGHO2_01_FULL_49_21]OGL37674.1 MAG: hypothetical protein A3E49_00025 [Candidatus Saccharibacteria bacterium RIFCSPHIGHO2_12_FULL_49_19]OGL37868.1 MAG: hypothetical protein A3B63_00455 [Candidatus Saccharibacteria bacterium RIFCSPLOWO2_01_FULL_49_22]